MSPWDEALSAVEEILAAPVEDGFPLPGEMFSGLGPIPAELGDRARRVAHSIAERITATEAIANSTLADLGWTRDRMRDLPQGTGAPVYLDFTA
jgi:hypothetical protein